MFHCIFVCETVRMAHIGSCQEQGLKLMIEAVILRLEDPLQWSSQPSRCLIFPEAHETS